MKVRVYLNENTPESVQSDIQKMLERLTNQQVCVRIVEEHTGIGNA